MTRRDLATWLVSFASIASFACDGERGRSDVAPSSAPPPIGAKPSAAPPPRAPPIASAAPSRAPVEALKVSFTTAIDQKDPADVLVAAEPGQRVYVHLALRNRGASPRTVTLVFKVGGEERSTTALQVEPSWRYRTWAYVTLKASDAGEVAVDVLDDSGASIASGSIPIKKKAIVSAAKKKGDSE